MQLKKGVDVLSSAGEKIGSLDRVVLDPQSNEVTHIIGEYAKPRFVVAQDVIPDDTVALEEGARVISSDGKQVGNVEEVIVETSTIASRTL